MDRYDDDTHAGASHAGASRDDDAFFSDSSYDRDDIAVEPSAPEEALEHLWTAAHELLRAVRMIVDAADEFVSSQRGATSGRAPRGPAPEREPRVHRIDIDGRDGAHEADDRSSGAPGTPGAAPH